MGMNYYWRQNACSACGHPPYTLHIGKSSMGWVFALRIHRDRGIRSLLDWEVRWRHGDGRIVDDEEREISPAAMSAVIRNRSRSDPPKMVLTPNCEIGPCNLLRATRFNGWPMVHGEGTWDLYDGEFS